MKTRLKNLYRIFLALILVKTSFFTNKLVAQPAKGIYLNASDFVKNNLSYVNFEGKRCKIKTHGFSFLTPITITCNEEIIHLSKDSVYGYKDREGIAHRFYKKTIFEILNPAENILLYRIMVSGKTKYEEAVFDYYFSKTAASAVLPLTLRNVENSFEENKLFIDFIEIHFKSDAGLLEYDPVHQKYKLNRLLELSRN